MTFRVGRKPTPRKQRVTILLDTGVIEYVKAKASKRSDQTLINGTLQSALRYFLFNHRVKLLRDP